MPGEDELRKGIEITRLQSL